MKTCAACHEDLPKDKFSKKQWKLNQRRCKVCISDNREVQQLQTTVNEVVDDGVGSMLVESMSLHDYNTSISDEELFKQPPPKEDCPICFLRMPALETGYKYKACCGKAICSGCIHEVAKDGIGLCPFCRTPAPTTEKELIRRTLKRVGAGDAEALFNIGCNYQGGTYGFEQNMDKAQELWHRAGELGCSSAYHNIGYAYVNDEGVGTDKKKALHYWELAAMGGDIAARHNLGVSEKKEGNMDRALKHLMIAVEDGSTESLEKIKQLYTDEFATKDDYAKALRSHQAYLDEIRSDQRDKAAAFDNSYKYY